METQKTEKTKNTILRKKISVDTIKTADLKKGDEVTGIFLQANERPWMDKISGEEKAIPQFLFEKTKGGDRFIVMADAGFKNAMNSSMVAPGDHIAVVKLEPVDLGGGKRVNQYDIYQLSETNN